MPSCLLGKIANALTATRKHKLNIANSFAEVKNLLCDCQLMISYAVLIGMRYAYSHVGIT